MSPLEEQLFELSKKIISEEHREIDSLLKQQYTALQKKILENSDFTKMPEALNLLLRMHDVDQDALDRGFERGGAVYAYRNMVGSLIAFLPLAITYIKTQPEHVKDTSFQLKMSAGYFASVVLASCVAVAINARVLLHCTPVQDAEFDGSPNIAPEIKKKSTPFHADITTELKKSLAKGDPNEHLRHSFVEINNEITTALQIGSVVSDEDLAKLRDKIKAFFDKSHAVDNVEKKDEGVRQYLARAQLNRVYIEGLKLQSTFQTMKVFGNLAAGWFSFLKKDPRLGMYIQLAFGFAQILMQRRVAPADQKVLQNKMFELEISSRPLKGKNDRRGDQLIRKMLRTPLEVRATNLQSLTESYVQTLAQEIADILQISAADYKNHRELLSKENDWDKYKGLEVEVTTCNATSFTDETLQYGVLHKAADIASRFPQHSNHGELSEILAAYFKERNPKIITLNFIEKLIELKRRDENGDLNESDTAVFHGMATTLQRELNPNEGGHHLLFLQGNFRGTLFAAFDRAKSREQYEDVVFDSPQLAATLGILSARYLDDEILLQILVDAIPDQCRALFQELTVAQTEACNSSKEASDPDTVPPDSPLEQEDVEDCLAALDRSTQGLVEDINSISRNAGRFSANDYGRIKDKLAEKYATHDDDKNKQIKDIWGIEGLEAELVLATRSMDHEKEKVLCSMVAEAIGMDLEGYIEYHELRMRVLDHHLRNLNDDESATVNAGRSRLASHSMHSRLKVLEEQYRKIENDPRHIVERRFDKVSDQHKKLVVDGMQITRNEGFFNLKTETGMLWKEGNRRAGNSPEYMAAYAAGTWRAFQLGITGANGPLIMSALVVMLEQIYKSTLQDPHAFKSPYWPKVVITGITAAALGANIRAAYRIADAKATPLGWPVVVQAMCGGTGSIAETVYQAAKLAIRDVYRDMTIPGSNTIKKFTEIGKCRIATRYYWQTLAGSLKINEGLAVLLRAGHDATAAKKVFEQVDKKIKAGAKERNDMRTALDEFSLQLTAQPAPSGPADRT